MKKILEDVARIMDLLIKEGKIRCWYCFFPTIEQLLNADVITSLSVVQSKHSMMERKWNKDDILLYK